MFLGLGALCFLFLVLGVTGAFVFCFLFLGVFWLVVSCFGVCFCLLSLVLGGWGVFGAGGLDE